MKYCPEQYCQYFSDSRLSTRLLFDNSLHIVFYFYASNYVLIFPTNTVIGESNNSILFSCGSNSINTAVYLSIFFLSVYLFVLVPGNCTVEYNQLCMCTLSVEGCSARQKPILLSFTTPAPPFRESY
jgi:hypothetical protein